MKILSVSITVFIITIYYSCAQHINTSSADALEIKKRILLVTLPDPSKHFLAQYAEEDSSKSMIFINDIEGQRKIFKKVVLERWKFNDSILIVTAKEAKSLMKQFPGKYALMRIDEQNQPTAYVRTNGITRVSQSTGWIKFDDSFEYNYAKRYGLMMLGITSIVIELPGRAVNVYLPKVSPSEGDFIFALHQMEYILTATLKVENYSSGKIYKETKHRSKELENKILLLDGKELKCKEEDIAKAYPYPFKIVNYETIENALKTGAIENVTIQSSRYDAANSVLCLSNTGNGTLYGYMTCPTFNYGAIDPAHITIQVNYPGITLEQLKELAKSE
jgi:hypothetical protein